MHRFTTTPPSAESVGGGGVVNLGVSPRREELSFWERRRLWRGQKPALQRLNANADTIKTSFMVMDERKGGGVATPSVRRHGNSVGSNT